MKPKEFFKRWKQGIMMVTPQQRLKVDLFSMFWIIFGLFAGAVAIGYTYYTTRTGWQLFICIVLFFSGILQVSAFIGKYQQYQSIKKIEMGEFEDGT